MLKKEIRGNNLGSLAKKFCLVFLLAAGLNSSSRFALNRADHIRQAVLEKRNHGVKGFVLGKKPPPALGVLICCGVVSLLEFASSQIEKKNRVY